LAPSQSSFLFLSILFSCYVAALQAGKDVKENLKNWAKQQEAELAEEQDSVDRIRKALEEARR
jgi:Skp family chaperone for outer membrane proteins